MKNRLARRKLTTREVPMQQRQIEITRKLAICRHFLLHSGGGGGGATAAALSFQFSVGV